MPYEIRQAGDNYKVINSESQEVKAVHEPPNAKEKAERQVALLHEVENNPGWESE